MNQNLHSAKEKGPENPPQQAINAPGTSHDAPGRFLRRKPFILRSNAAKDDRQVSGCGTRAVEDASPYMLAARLPA